MESLPITCRFANPWIEDNKDFVKSLSEIDSQIKSAAPVIRAQEEETIIHSEGGNPFKIGAVDAAVITKDCGDFATVLVQAAYHLDGVTTLDKSIRIGPTDHESARSFAVGARVARECLMLSEVTTPTIADNSMFSFLMEANQALTAWANNSEDDFKDIPETITTCFEKMASNKNVIAMSKLGVSKIIYNKPEYKGLITRPISDSMIFSMVLEPGEYVEPMHITALGKFGVEQRGPGEAWDHKAIKKIYVNDLFYTYYKPWAYKRAYRIEGHRSVFTDDLFASIKEATRTREIAEPLSQFQVDFNVKQLGGISELYGERNRFRFPFTGFHRT